MIGPLPWWGHWLIVIVALGIIPLLAFLCWRRCKANFATVAKTDD